MTIYTFFYLSINPVSSSSAIQRKGSSRAHQCGVWGNCGGRHRDPIQFPYRSDARRHRCKSGPGVAVVGAFLLDETMVGVLIAWKRELCSLECPEQVCFDPFLFLFLACIPRVYTSLSPGPAHAFLPSSQRLSLALPRVLSPLYSFEASFSPPSCTSPIGPCRSRGCSLWISLAPGRSSRRLLLSFCPTKACRSTPHFHK